MSRGPGRLPDGRAVKRVRFHGRYKPGEVIRRIPIPGGGELALETCSPIGQGAPLVRWVADYQNGKKQETIESYLQTPHGGFTQLTGETAERVIQADAKRVLELVDRKRRAARST